MSILTYQGQNITQRDVDGYINATQMCKANGKEVSHWLATDDFNRYADAIAQKLGIPRNSLLIYTSEGFPAKKAYWAHPDLAIKLGRWISVEFELWCDEHIKTLMKTGSTEIAPQVPQTYAQALLEAGRLALENEKLKLQAVEDKPKIQFAETVEKTEDHLTLNSYAKLIGYGHHKLMKELRDRKILMRNNIAYQKYINSKYFQTKSTQCSDGKIRLQTVVTGKGQLWLHQKLGIKTPLIRQQKLF